MPGSLTHLRIAVELLPVIAPAAPYHFVAGNLAPDAGVLQPDKSYAPPKTRTHFKMPGQRPFALADWLFYQRHMLHREPAPSPEEDSFLQGYFCHLMSDNLWAYRAGKAFVRGQFAPVDAHFLATHPAFALPDAVPLSIPPDMERLLERRLIEHKMAAMAHLLAYRPAENLTPVNPADVKRVEDFIAEMTGVFPRVLRRLQQGIFPPDEAISTLSGL